MAKGKSTSAKGARAKKTNSADDRLSKGFIFSRTNALLLLLGLLSILVGYIALGQGSISLAPVLLMAGYCLAIPLALLPWKVRSKT